MLLKQAIDNKFSFKKQAELEINCKNCVRSKKNKGYCLGNIKGCKHFKRLKG